MYLIDSSAWIEYLRPKGSAKVKERVREVLDREGALTCGVVIVEVLRGALDEKSFQVLSDHFKALQSVPMDDEVIERAARWGFALLRKGKRVSTTDLLIAAAAHGKAVLLHIDSDFQVISSVTGLNEVKLAL